MTVSSKLSSPFGREGFIKMYTTRDTSYYQAKGNTP
jgi:hypothetical protein